jgi:hypothetical protein
MQNQEMANEQEWAKAENWSDSSMGLYFSKRDTASGCPSAGERSDGPSIWLVQPVRDGSWQSFLLRRWCSFSC